MVKENNLKQKGKRQKPEEQHQFLTTFPRERERERERAYLPRINLQTNQIIQLLLKICLKKKISGCTVQSEN